MIPCPHENARTQWAVTDRRRGYLVSADGLEAGAGVSVLAAGLEFAFVSDLDSELSELFGVPFRA